MADRLAILNLAGEDGQILTDRLYKAASDNPRMSTLPAGPARRTLRSPNLAPPTATNSITLRLQRASELRRGGKSQAARRLLQQIRQDLLRARPDKTWRQHLATVHFELGVISFFRTYDAGGQDYREARGHFFLTRQLDPQRLAPDASQFLPELIKAYNAKTSAARTRLSHTREDAKIFIDGKPAQATPFAWRGASGKHYVTTEELPGVFRSQLKALRGVDTEISPRIFRSADYANEASVAFARTDDDLLRRRVLAALSDRVAVDWIIVVESRNQSLGTLAYRRARGLISPWVSAAGRSATALLAPVVFESVIVVPPPPPPWWRTRRGKTLIISSGALTVAAVVITFVLTSTPDTVGGNCCDFSQ